MSEPRLILIPGLGADYRVFEPQRRAGLKFEVPRFPVPTPKDNMASYAARIREELDLQPPCVVGGMSFGGMLSCELALQLEVKCVLLIASCRDGSALPTMFRLAEQNARILPEEALRQRAWALGQMFNRTENLKDEEKELVDQMASEVPIELIRHSGRIVLEWKCPPNIPCPIHHIHGENDWLMPLEDIEPPPDEIVPGAGHLVNMTHATQVNDFILRHVNRHP
jgi:pimeloyl-ACP methyl ester carboxylesterase